MPILDIDKLFTAQPIDADQAAQIGPLEQHFKQLGHAIQLHCPDSAERMLALRKLQECRMWANTAIVHVPKSG